MKKITSALLLAGSITAISSCAKKEDPAPEPIKQPKVKKSPPPAPSAPVTPITQADPTSMFRDPTKNVSLPTDAQVNEGRETSIGTGGTLISKPDSAPTISITPPSAPATLETTGSTEPTPKEDRLDP